MTRRSEHSGRELALKCRNMGPTGRRAVAAADDWASPFLIGLDSFAMNAPVWLLTLVGGMLAIATIAPGHRTISDDSDALPDVDRNIVGRGAIRPLPLSRYRSSWE